MKLSALRQPFVVCNSDATLFECGRCCDKESRLRRSPQKGSIGFQLSIKMGTYDWPALKHRGFSVQKYVVNIHSLH